MGDSGVLHKLLPRSISYEIQLCYCSANCFLKQLIFGFLLCLELFFKRTEYQSAVILINGSDSSPLERKLRRGRLSEALC